MRRHAALVATLMLASCGGSGTGDDAPQPANMARPAATPATPQAPARQIGTTSSLSAQTSALTGAVTDFQVTTTDTATVIALAADTLFDFDKADLTPAAVTNLDRVAEIVRQGGAGTVTVTGYTDAKGEDAYNFQLSENRANAVVMWLRQRPGLDTRAFSATGKGEANPVAPNAKPDGSDDPQGRAKNRRVVVEVPRG